MRVILIFIICGIILAFIDCKPKGAISPQDAFFQLRRAYFTANAEEIELFLSKESKEKIEQMCAAFRKMQDKQQESLAQHFAIPVEKIKNLTVKEYISHFLFADISKIIKKQDMHIDRIERKEYRATVFLKNGIELQFVKEGPYWKFDLTDF